MLTDFLNSVIVDLAVKFATRSVLYIPPHLQRVTTLLCEKPIIKNSKILTYLTQYHHFALLLKKLSR